MCEFDTASIHLNAKYHHFFEFKISFIDLLSTIDAIHNVSVHVGLDPRSPEKFKSWARDKFKSSSFGHT